MTTDTPTMHPALRLLEKSTPPLYRGRQPYWTPAIPAPATECLIPSWNWRSIHDVPEGQETVTLDVNGAYLAGAGGARIAHSQLEHTGRPRPGQSLDPRTLPPGYYRIMVPYWAFSGTIVSPLGDSPALDDPFASIWIAAPTLELLLELEDEGSLGGIEILDSYTATTCTDLRGWVERLKVVRNGHLDRIDGAQTDAARAAYKAQYQAFKDGYSAALSMMLTGTKCRTRRPDWTHTVHARFAAATWRKAWRYGYTGSVVVAMGSTDQITVLKDELPAAMSRTQPPFRIDPTGRTLGHLKPKSTPTPPARSQMHFPAPGEDLF